MYKRQAYEADVLVKAVIPENDKKRIEKTIIEQTNGTAKLEWGDCLLYTSRCV